MSPSFPSLLDIQSIRISHGITSHFSLCHFLALSHHHQPSCFLSSPAGFPPAAFAPLCSLLSKQQSEESCKTPGLILSAQTSQWASIPLKVQANPRTRTHNTCRYLSPISSMLLHPLLLLSLFSTLRHHFPPVALHFGLLCAAPMKISSFPPGHSRADSFGDGCLNSHVA